MGKRNKNNKQTIGKTMKKIKTYIKHELNYDKITK